MAQLKDLGFTYGQIRRRVDQGRLHPRFPGVFSVGRARLNPAGHLLAALLSAGPRSFLSHRTAAAVHRLRAINIHDIEVTVAGGARPRPGITVHETRREPHPEDVRTRGLVRVSSVPRSLVELAARETPQELERLVTVAVQKRLLRLDARDGLAALEAALARHERWPGRAKLGAVLAAYRRTESHASQLELAFDRWLVGHPEIPEPQRNIHIDVWEIDRCWPDQHLIVELDGRPYHVAARDMEKDRVKDAALQRLGNRVLRITDFRFEHDRAGILGDLRHFLAI